MDDKKKRARRITRIAASQALPIVSVVPDNLKLKA